MLADDEWMESECSLQIRTKEAEVDVNRLFDLVECFEEAIDMTGSPLFTFALYERRYA